MNRFASISLALLAAAFISQAPVLAADANAPAAAAQQKPDMAGAMKEKAANMIDQAKQKADSAADKLENALGVKKDKADQMSGAMKDKAQQGADMAGKAKTEVLEVQQESVTVETPKGVEQETVTTVTPETPAK